MKSQKALGILLTVAGLLACGLGLTGCAGPKAVAATQSSKIFYPAPPDPARFQFLMSFSDAAQWASAAKSSFSEFVVGKVKTETLVTALRNPFGLAARDGKLYVTDVELNCVHVIDFVNKAYTQLGEGKVLLRPRSVTIAPDGTRYVCDMGLHQVAVFDANDKFIKNIGDPQHCQAPADLAVIGDELYVLDFAASRLEVWSKDGVFKRAISKQGDGPEDLKGAWFIDGGPDRLVYVTDNMGSIVKAFNGQGRFIRTIGEAGDVPGTFERPKGIKVDRTNGIVYVTDAYWDTLQLFNLQGQLLLCIQDHSEGAQGLHTPTGIALDPTSLKAFAQYIDPDFKAEYLVFVANEYGKNKIAVYAYGRSKSAPPPLMSVPATQPEK